MAAIYSGIHLKLKSPRTAWEDKLKLARFAWVSSQCVLPNKEQVLLDWASHALTGYYSHKVEFSQNVLEGLWRYLDDLLHSRKLRSLLSQGKTISLRLAMAQVLMERVQECVCVGAGPSVSLSTLLSVCQGILSAPALAAIFTTKYELMVDLLAKLCSLACHRLQHPSITRPAHTQPQPTTETLTSQDEPMAESLPAQPVGDPDTVRSESVKVTFTDKPMTELDKSQSQPMAESHSGHVFEVLLQVLTCYLSVQRQQANPNRVFTMVTNHLLQPIMLLRHLLTSGEHTHSQMHSHTLFPRVRQQMSRDLRGKIDSILQSALFPHEHLNSYKEELLPAAKEDHGKRGPGGAKGFLKPVGTMLCKLNAQGYCEPTLHYAVKSSALPLLFKFSLENYVRGGGGEEEKLMCFYLLTHLVPTLDMDLEVEASSTAPLSPGKASHPDPIAPGQSSPLVLTPSSPESWSLALLALEALLNQALSEDIYNVATDRIRHGEVQLTFYRTLVQTLFNQAQPSVPAWYRCLKVLLCLNHLILEPDLYQVLTSAWVDSDCMEPRVQRARQLLVSSLLQTYTKLRQLPRLASELLAVVCHPTLDDLRPPLLSEGICASLRSCLLDTPPSQGLEICSAILGSIRRYILPGLRREGEEEMRGGGEEEMEVDGDGDGEKKERESGGEAATMDQETVERDGDKGGEGVPDGERGDASLKLLSLSQLLHAVLFSLKTIDNDSPLPLVRQTHSLIEDMEHVVTDVLQLVSSDETSHGGPETDPDSKRKNKKSSDLMGSKQVPNQEPEPELGVLWRQKTQEGALLLRYTWVEVDTLFQIHCSKYTSPEAAQPSAPGHTGAASSIPTTAASTVLSYIEALLSEVILTSHPRPSPILPTCSPMSSFLLKLLTLQQLKKALLDTALLAQAGTAALLTRAAQFILARDELGMESDREQTWDGQIGSVDVSSYHVARWHLIASNLPLLAPHLTEGDIGCIANVLLSSLLGRQTGRLTDRPPASPASCLSVSLISSQLLQSPILVEIPLVYSATVRCLMQRIVGVLALFDAPQVRPMLLKFQEVVQGREIAAEQSESDVSEAPPSVKKLEAVAEEVLRLSEAGEVSISLTETQTLELVKLLLIAENLNADGMSSEDFSSLFLLLFFMLTSTSSLPDRGPGSPPDPGNDAQFLGKLLRLLASLLEGRSSQSVLKLIHGSSLLQATVSSLLSFSDRGRFCLIGSSDWLDLVKAAQGFIHSLVQLIIIRNSSVRLNLEQFTSYLTSNEVAGRRLATITAQPATDPAELAILGQPEPGVAILSLQLLLASLTSLSQVMTVTLEKSKLLDQTLSQLLARTTAVLGPAVQACFNAQTAQTPVVLSQAFLVEVVTVMLQSELASLPTKGNGDSTEGQPRLRHTSLYHSFNQQILREISSAPRPMNFLVSSLRSLSAFYCAVERMGGKGERRGEEIRGGEEKMGGKGERGGEEIRGGEEKIGGEGEDELYLQTLQNIYRLLAAPWLSVSDVSELEPAVEELLRHLLERCTAAQFNRLLMLIREGLDTGKLRGGNSREVLSAVIITKLLSCCPLPELCSKALWLIAPQLISTLVFIVKESSQDLSLTVPVTIPTVTAMTSLLRQGEGWLSNPHHVTLVLGALQLVPLDHLALPVYHSSFLAVHEALFTIIQCHPQVMLKAAPSFLNVFYRLVASIMQEGRQRGDRDTGSLPDSEVELVKCSRLVERMYSHIAAIAEGFTTMSAFIVAQYVTDLQKVTLRPDIKAHLTEGIYWILDLCVEQDVKFLSAGLQQGVREVFNELYSTYTHYHKTQRQGEEKYTA